MTAVALMTTAAVAEAVESSGMKHEKLAPAPAQSNFNVMESDFNATAQRREREEHTPHYVSYNSSQRTPSRTGKA
jgi:hypothetical protein